MIKREICGELLSPLGMGNMRLPTTGEGFAAPIDREKAQAIIDYVYESGVNYFDTAYMYHGGESERFIGQALRKYPRDSYYLATKMPSSELEKGRSPREIFEEQLEKCGVDHFDFYLLHNLSEGSYDVFTDPDKGVIPYLLEQKAQGRIGHLGLSSHASPATLKRFLDAYDFPEFVQIQLNYFDWDYQDARQQYEIISGKGLPVWVMEPCRGGRLASLSEAADGILKAACPARSVASWAFRYLMSLPAVGMILSGMTQMDQAVDNVSTFNDYAPLSQSETAALEQALSVFRDQHIIPCTTCHYCDGCPMDLDIPELLRILSRYRLNPSPMIWGDLARIDEARRPDACIACGACTHKCPQNIPIPDLMGEFAGALSSLPKPHFP